MTQLDAYKIALKYLSVLAYGFEHNISPAKMEGDSDYIWDYEKCLKGIKELKQMIKDEEVHKQD